MTNILKSIFNLFLLLALIGLAGVGTILFRPDLVLTEPMLKRSAPLLLHFGYKLSWDQGSIRVINHSFFERSIDIQFKNFCIDASDVAMSGCFNEIHFGATLEFRNRKFHLSDVGPVQMSSQKMSIDLKPSKPTPAHRGGLFSEIVNSETNFHDFSLSVKDWNYISGQSNYIVAVTIADNASLGHDKPWALSGSLSADDVRQKAKISGQFKLEGQKYLFAVPVKMVAKVNVAFGEKLKADAWVDLKFLKEEAAEYQLQIDLKNGSDLSLDARLNGLFSTEKTTGQIHGEVATEGFKIPIGQSKDCKFSVGFEGKIDLDCPFQIASQKALLKGLDTSKDLSQIHFTTELSMQSENGLGAQGPWSGAASLKIRTLGDASININGDLTSDFKDSALSADLVKKLSVKASTQIAVAHFEKLVERLRTTPYAVPAPLNVMGGSLDCKLQEKLAFSDLKIPFSCETKLKSSNQALNMGADGFFSLEKQPSQKYKPNLNLKLVFDTTQIALPRFGLKGPPPLIPDSRFKTSLDAPKVDHETALTYTIQLDTAKNKDVKILSNLAKVPVPIEFHILVRSGEKPKGNVRVKDFSAELFRREAQIKYFDIYIGQGDEEPIHGMVEVHYTDDLVKIYLDGTVREPVIRFESVPPLAQNDIISVLLFGHATDPGNTDQASSVSNTDAAIADKALGLASMYLLASTPVESIGYNSQSQTFTAKFHLAEGTSLNIGAGDAGLKEVGVNRHLGGPWYIYTYLKNPSANEDRSTAAFLQWVLRY